MLELQNNTLVFTFPKVHHQAKLTIKFHRTLRIPDDDKAYPLPPSLGAFPMMHTRDQGDEVLPTSWKEHGGVIIPMYQSEALWMSFHSDVVPNQERPYPFAVKVAAGKKSALTGDNWKEGLNPKDYCVVPDQPWLDGFVVGDGVIRQFVAVPLGQGLSVEEQLGDDQVGGLQIEVFPMKRKKFEAKYPRVSTDTLRRIEISDHYYSSNEIKTTKHLTVSAQNVTATDSRLSTSLCLCDCEPDMAMGAGGRMTQQVYDDPHKIKDWSRKKDGVRRCFIHLANSLMWRQITGEDPPTTPLTASDYKRHNFPWFDYYSDQKALEGSDKLKGVKSVKDKAKDKGLKGVLPENNSIEIKKNEILVAKTPEHVVNGKW